MWYPPVIWTLVYNPHQLVRYIYHLSTISPTYCSYVHQLNAIPNWGTTMYTYSVIDHNNGYKTNHRDNHGENLMKSQMKSHEANISLWGHDPLNPSLLLSVSGYFPAGHSPVPRSSTGVPCRAGTPCRNRRVHRHFWWVFSKNGLVDEQKMVEVDVIDVTWKPGVVDKYSDIEWHWVTWDLMNTWWTPDFRSWLWMFIWSTRQQMSNKNGTQKLHPILPNGNQPWLAGKPLSSRCFFSKPPFGSWISPYRTMFPWFSEGWFLLKIVRPNSFICGAYRAIQVHVVITSCTCLSQFRGPSVSAHPCDSGNSLNL